MGVQRGEAPLAGAWGCPPDIIFSPFLARKGVRGMVERVFHHPDRVAYRTADSGIGFCPGCIEPSPCEINTEMEKQSE